MIREIKNRIPFRPFVLRCVDGRTFEILHRDFIQVDSTSGPYVIIHNPENDRVAYVDVLLIVSLDVDEPPQDADGSQDHEDI